MNKILQEDFDLAPCMVAGYESFMNGLLNIVHSGPICESVGEQIKSYVLDFVQNHPLDSFDRFSDETYTRNYIGRDTESGWEAIVMSWKKGNRTAIHAHPQFAGYTFADGEFLVEVFEPFKEGIRLVQEMTISDIHGLYAIGEVGKFITRIYNRLLLNILQIISQKYGRYL